jgi:plastocyanin
VAVTELVAFSFILIVSFVLPFIPSAKAVTWSVDIPGFTYDQQVLTINVGDSVTWHNSHTAPHSVTSNTSSWAEQVLSPGETSAVIPFNSEGTFGYHCLYHPVSSYPNMWGEVRVVTGVIPEFSSASAVVGAMMAAIVGFMIVRRKR